MSRPSCPSARSFRPYSSLPFLPRDPVRGGPREERPGMPLRGRRDKDGVVTGDRADDLREARGVERDRHRVRRPRWRAKHDEVPCDATLDGVVLTKPTQPLGPTAARNGRRRGVDVRPVPRDLHEAELDDVARDGRLRRVEPRALERANEILLRAELLLRDDAEQRLLTVVFARELLHAAASNTVPTRSPARSRSIASPERASTIAERQPALAATRQASTFGSIPPSIVPSSTSSFARSRSSRARTRPSFDRTPGTSVTNTSSRAPRLAAIAPAALSALTLSTSYFSPAGSSSAAGAMTGTRPSPISSSRSALSTRRIDPTYPSDESSRCARRMPPSMPVRPTAGTPRSRRAATMRSIAISFSENAARSASGLKSAGAPRVNTSTAPMRMLALRSSTFAPDRPAAAMMRPQFGSAP